VKVICSRETLLGAVQLVGAAVAARELKPILRNLKMVADGVGLTLMATDLELGIRHEMRSPRIEKEGAAILPTNKITQILREATDEELTIEADENHVLVQGLQSEWEMPSENPDEFPDIPIQLKEETHEAQAGVVAQMIRRTIFAAAKESTKFAMNGILWEIDGKNLRLVATDSKRLALAISPPLNRVGQVESKVSSHLTPTKAMQLLERHLANLPPDAPLTFVLRANDALFRTETTTLYTRLVEGRYPPYREIFPKKTNVKMNLAVGPFLTAVRQSAIMTDDESRRVLFHFEKSQLILQAQGPSTGRAKVPLAIEYDGPALDIQFDPTFLTEMLRTLGPEDPLTLELIDGVKPALFKSGSDYSYLVMPMA
jgi:DNA polymerase-3 subunit beta